MSATFRGPEWLPPRDSVEEAEFQRLQAARKARRIADGRARPDEPELAADGSFLHDEDLQGAIDDDSMARSNVKRRRAADYW